ncbi:MAG: outer membrane lipoprotein carrier protein LolA [Gemmatimonadales bacterium]|nr:MAG: outer membrane lipoprotein carrier protein LolA [Gemmatimonadales bacterium]
MIFSFAPRALRVILPLLGIGVLFGAPAPAASQDALSILTAAAERHEGLTGFCADFRQVVDNDILRETIRSHGELCHAPGNRFDMRFADPPDGDRVVADGEYLWIYLPSTDPGQVFRGDAGAAGGQFDLHREFLGEPGRRYRPTLEGREDVDGRETHVLFLEPLVSSPFLRARIWVDAQDSMLRRVEITEDEGFVRTVELSGIRLNPQIAPERFRFEPPAGVQVIRR